MLVTLNSQSSYNGVTACVICKILNLSRSKSLSQMMSWLGVGLLKYLQPANRYSAPLCKHYILIPYIKYSYLNCIKMFYTQAHLSDNHPNIKTPTSIPNRKEVWGIASIHSNPHAKSNYKQKYFFATFILQNSVNYLQ